MWAAGGLAAAKLVLSISVPLPDAQILALAVSRAGQPAIRFYNFLGGGALARGSMFALGVLPYLSARLAMFVAGQLSPRVRSMSATKHQWWTRGLTVGYSVVQSYGYALWTQQLPGAVSSPGIAYTVETIVMLTSVSTLLMLFAEEATAPDQPRETPMLPREAAQEQYAERPLHVSHSTPLP